MKKLTKAQLSYQLINAACRADAHAARAEMLYGRNSHIYYMYVFLYLRRRDAYDAMVRA